MLVLVLVLAWLVLAWLVLAWLVPVPVLAPAWRVLLQVLQGRVLLAAWTAPALRMLPWLLMLVLLQALQWAATAVAWVLLAPWPLVLLPVAGPGLLTWPEPGRMLRAVPAA